MMVYRPKYLRKKQVPSVINKGVIFKSKGPGKGELFVNGEELSKVTKKTVITIEAGCITTVELAKLTTGDIEIDGEVEVIENGQEEKT